MGLSHCISYLDHITTRRRSWQGLSSRDDEMKFMQMLFSFSKCWSREFTITLKNTNIKSFSSNLMKQFLELCNRLQLVCFCHEFLIFRQQQKDSNWDDNCESWIQVNTSEYSEDYLSLLSFGNLGNKRSWSSNTNPSFNNRNLMKRNSSKIKSHQEKFMHQML